MNNSVDTGEPGCMERFDKFLEAALAGVCANGTYVSRNAEEIAVHAFHIAAKAARLRNKLARRVGRKD